MKKNLFKLIIPIATSIILVSCGSSDTSNVTPRNHSSEENTQIENNDVTSNPENVIPADPNNNESDVVPPAENEATPSLPSDENSSNSPSENSVEPTVPDNTETQSDNSQDNGSNNSEQSTTPPLGETPFSPSPDSENSGSFLPAVEQEIFRMVNEERTKAGVPTLSYNTTMEKYARIKSKDMGDRNYFSHENPEGQLITEQMSKDGVTYSAWGENIAYVQGSASNAASEIMNMWMNSPGHRQNILSTNFTSIGVGVSQHGNTIYATQEFCR